MVAATAAATIEDFEDDTPFGAPEHVDYTYAPTSSDSAYVVASGGIGGSQAFKVVDGASDTALLTYNRAPCEAEVFKFAFRKDTFFPAAGTFVGFTNTGDVTSSSQTMAGVVISSAGGVTERWNEQSPGAEDSASTLVGLTIATGTWYNVTMRWTSVGGDPEPLVPCEAGPSGGKLRFSVSFDDQGVGAFSDLTYPVQEWTEKRFWVTELGSPGLEGMTLDNIGWTSTPVEAFGAAATSGAYTGINGFDVDSSGRTVIIRHDTGANVSTLSGTSLIQVGAYATPNCNRPNGVSVISQADETYTSFTDCDSGGDTDTIRVRSATLGAPAFPSGCNQECEKDVTDDSSLTADINVPSTLTELGFISQWPFSYTYDSSGLSQDATASWTYATNDGKVGVFAVTYNDGLKDFSDFAESLLDGSASPQVDQICTWPFADKDYMVGATLNGATSAYETGVTLSGGSLARSPNAQISRIFTGGATHSEGVAVACAQDRVFLLTGEGSSAGTLFMIQVVGGIQQLWSVPVEGRYTRGVAMSQDGAFVAWIDSDTGYVAHADNGTVLATFAWMGGSLTGLALDSRGSSLWASNTTHVARYEVASATCVDDCAITEDSLGNPLPGITGGPAGGPTPCPGGSTSLIGADLCTDIDTDGDGNPEISGALVGWLVGALFPLAFGFGLGALWPPGIGLGLAIGIGVAVGMGLWPIFMVAVAGLAAIVTAVLMLGRR